MRFDATSLAIVLGIPLALGGLWAWWAVNARRRLRRWADANGLTILETRVPGFSGSPFLFRVNLGDVVYRLSARDARGEVVQGWARVRSFPIGPVGPVDARWDDRSPAPMPPKG